MTKIHWDARWRTTIADPSELEWARVGFAISAFLDLVDGLERESWRRVLVVGCGISTELALMAHAGYEVIALDVSRVAIDHITSAPATRSELARWLWRKCIEERPSEDPDDPTPIREVNPARTFTMLDSMYRPGGSVQYHCVSFEAFTDSAPFDIVYCPHIWQCLDDRLRAELPRRAFGWLAPGGACCVATHNLTDRKGDFRDGRLNELLTDFRAAGFFLRDEVSRSRRPRRVASKLMARLAAGAKMFDLFNGSG